MHVPMIYSCTVYIFIHKYIYMYVVSVWIVAAFEYLKSHPVGQIDEQEFAHYCGVGVVVTIDQIQEQVYSYDWSPHVLSRAASVYSTVEMVWLS